MDEAPLSNTPAIDMVGKNDKIDALSMLKSRLKTGDRVMSLIKWGGNSRYVRIATNQLVKVPEGVDPAQAVCLAEAYLAAFQALHYTQGDKAHYINHSMIGRSIFGDWCLDECWSGCTQTGEIPRHHGRVCCQEEQHHAVLTTLGVIPLRRNPKLWPAGVMGMMDLVIDATGDLAGDHATASHFLALHEQGDLKY